MKFLVVLTICSALAGFVDSKMKGYPHPPGSYDTYHADTNHEGKLGSGLMTRKQLETLESRFKDNQPRYKTSFTFQQWKRWRQKHGFVCNVDEDCSWLTATKRMGCSGGEVRWAGYQKSQIQCIFHFPISLFPAAESHYQYDWELRL